MSFSGVRLPMRKILGLLVVALSLAVVNAVPAAAHTGFESSSPSDGEAVGEPVAEIVLTFSGPAKPAGDGFVVLDPTGTLREPDEVVTVDDLTWTLTFADPLAGGLVGVRWKVAAPDAHPIEGSFSFTVASPPTTTTRPTTTLPTTTLPTTTTRPAAEPTDTTPSTAVGTEPAAVTTERPDPDPVPTSTTDDPDTATAAMDDFLTTGSGSAFGADRLGSVGRVATLLGAVVAIGGAVFVARVLAEHDPETIGAVRWIRLGGGFLVVGSIIEAVAQVAVIDSSWSGLFSGSAITDALATSFGLAMVLRAVGGVVVALGARLRIGTAALVGLGLVLVSFLFDGHTVTEGPRWLHAIANVVHVSAAATWAGGVFLLAWVLAGRRRGGVDLRVSVLALRFSVVATVALVAAAAAGTVLAVVILDSPSDLWSTPWGQLLIVKVVLVGAAAAGGGYNHRVMIPALEREPGSGTVTDRFRTVVKLEVVALAAVTIVTALLIAASSV